MKLRAFYAVGIAALSMGLLTGDASPQVATGAGNVTADQFVIGPYAILMPRDVFLLVRKGREIGAIRFTSIEQGSVTGTGTARYESYFQSDGSGSFKPPGVRKKTGQNDLKPLKGIGRASFQFGNDKVQIGKWAFRSGYPGRINMWPYRGSQKDCGYEFAPTSARDIGEIDASDKRLRWFRFDQNTRAPILVADLPK